MFAVFYFGDTTLILLVKDGAINKEIYFAGSLTSATIEELQRGLYRIMLKACTNAGPGPPTDPMEISDINMPRKSHQ